MSTIDKKKLYKRAEQLYKDCEYIRSHPMYLENAMVSRQMQNAQRNLSDKFLLDSFVTLGKNSMGIFKDIQNMVEYYKKRIREHEGENVKPQEKNISKFASNASLVGAVAVSAPGFAIEGVAKISGGLLKSVGYGALHLMIPMNALHLFFSGNMGDAKTKIEKVGYGALYAISAPIPLALALTSGTVGMILKTAGFLLNNAGAIISIPFKKAGRGLLKLGDSKLAQEIDKADKNLETHMFDISYDTSIL